MRIRRIEEKEKPKGKATPKGTKRKKEPDPQQPRMTQYFLKRDKIEAKASKSNQGATCGPLMGVPGSCEPTTTSGGATGLVSEVSGGTKEEKAKKRTKPTVLERWIRPGGPGKET